MKTSELTGAALDWAVARCEGEAVRLIKGQLETLWTENGWKPSTDWALGGPIIEREKISLEFMPGAGDAGADVWVATRIEHPAFSEECGPTPLIAAMRCFVASTLGDEIEIPEELTMLGAER